MSWEIGGRWDVILVGGGWEGIRWMERYFFREKEKGKKGVSVKLVRDVNMICMTAGVRFSMTDEEIYINPTHNIRCYSNLPPNSLKSHALRIPETLDNRIHHLHALPTPQLLVNLPSRLQQRLVCF